MISLDKILFHLDLKQVVYSVQGNNISVRKLAAIDPEVKEALCYYVGDNPEKLNGIQRSVIICNPGLEIAEDNENTIIFTVSPQLCFYYLSSLFQTQQNYGIHTQALVHNSTSIGRNVTIGPFCTIEECDIGDNVIIESGVKIHKGTVIGKNVHIQSNSVIGATGVMWAWDGNNKIRCVQTGNVKIEDDVFIGSNVTIVRGAFENLPTIIGKGSMIAHGTMIAHGSVIGSYNHFANNVSIAGSVKTEENCFFGSGSVVRPHILIPKETIVGAGAVVVKNFMEEGLTLIGNPARKLCRNNNEPSGVPARL